MGVCIIALLMLTSCNPTQMSENTPATLTEPESDLSTIDDNAPQTNIPWEFPPLVFVNDSLYRRYIAAIPNSLNNDFIYIGRIDSYILHDQEPTANSQANRANLLGAEIYQSGNYLIIVYDGSYDYYYLESDFANAKPYILRNKGYQP